MSLGLTREIDLANDWGIGLTQFRILRRRHGWAHVRLSRQDIRYTAAQIEHMVHQMTVVGTPVRAKSSGQTARSARRAS